MTEVEWQECDEPETLLEYGRLLTTARKCRLLAASFCRHVLPVTREKCCQRAVEIAEQFADGLASFEAMLTVSEQVAEAYISFPNPASVNTEPPLSFKAESVAIQSTRFLTWNGDGWLSACCRCTYLAALRWALLRAGPGEAVAGYSSLVRWQVSLIRDVLGNPFRPVAVNPTWLTPGVIELARTIYEGRAFDRMPELADTLERAGCTDAAVLGHCRKPGLHTRGCFVIDLLLRKE